MSQPKVYLETSFFRYLMAIRSIDPIKARRQQLTRNWWELERGKFVLLVSPVVYEEFCEVFSAKIPPREAAARLVLVKEAELLPLNHAILELARLLLEPGGPLPTKAGADALHWAVSATFGCEYLLTWNFKHLNNALIKRRAERIIEEYGYESPTICTPEQME